MHMWLPTVINKYNCENDVDGYLPQMKTSTSPHHYPLTQSQKNVGCDNGVSNSSKLRDASNPESCIHSQLTMAYLVFKAYVALKVCHVGVSNHTLIQSSFNHPHGWWVGAMTKTLWSILAYNYAQS